MQNKVVTHNVTGELVKGVTNDFFPNKHFFHIKDNASGEVLEVDVSHLKAIYFVKSFEGDPAHNERDDLERSGFGKKIRIHFNDGEALIGYTQGFSPNRSGFFVFPSDPNSNNDRVFIVNSATDEINFI